jgi:hypothetical protein
MTNSNIITHVYHRDLLANGFLVKEPPAVYDKAAQEALQIAKFHSLNNKKIDPKKKLLVGVCDTNNDFKDLIAEIVNGIIVNESNNKIYSIIDSIKKVIGKNKSGEDFTDENFGDKVKVVTNNGTISNNTTISETENTSSSIDINTLLKKFNKMEKTIKNLKESNKKIKESNKTLKESNQTLMESYDDINESNKSMRDKVDNLKVDVDTLQLVSASTKNNKDDITGLESRVSIIEASLKFDAINPSPDENSGVGYYINRNREDIVSTTSQFDSVFTRLASLETNIAGNHISDYTNFDVIAKINGLTSRLTAVEDVLA